MWGSKLALAALVSVGAGAAALVALQTATPPAPVPTPTVTTASAGTGWSDPSAFPPGRPATRALQRQRARAATRPGDPAELPLVLAAQPEYVAPLVDPALEAQRAARRAAREAARAAKNPERVERRELREKWKELPKEQRQAVRQECERQGLDKKQIECLRLVQNAPTYALRANEVEQQKRRERRQASGQGG